MVKYYDHIPQKFIGKKVLEVGCNPRILDSKIASKILAADYTGIDAVIRFPDKQLKVILGNIIDYQLTEKYDTILLIAVLEHIHFGHWDKLIAKLKEALVVGGHIIVVTPYKQRLARYIIYPGNFNIDFWQNHTVFGIDKRVMRRYFPKSKLKTVTFFWWREDKAPYLRAIGRLIKRFFTRRLFRRSIIVFWKKK